MSTPPSNVHDIDEARYWACFAAGQALAEGQIEKFLDGSLPVVAEHARDYINSVEGMIEVLVPDAGPNEIARYTTMAMTSLLIGSILGGLAISQTALVDYIQTPHPENQGHDPFDPFVNATCDESIILIGGALVRINAFMNARAGSDSEMPDEDNDLVRGMGPDLLHAVQQASSWGPHTMDEGFIDEMMKAGKSILEDWIKLLEKRNLPIEAEAFELILLACAAGFPSSNLLLIQPAAAGIIRGYAAITKEIFEEYDGETEH